MKWCPIRSSPYPTLYVRTGSEGHLSRAHGSPVRYNRGMVRKEKRALGMVCVFRWSEEINGQRRQRKEVIGATKKFPTEGTANREADRLRCRLNEQKQSLSLKSLTFGGTNQPLPESRTPALVEIRPNGKPIVCQELDRACVAPSCCRQHEKHANSRLAGQGRAPRRNQAEDQEHPVRNLLARHC